MIGTTISHYKILEKLGAGGMGVVYKAHDTKLDRTVALKFLPPHLTVNNTDKERFLQEAKAAAALNHPNVCVIHDIKEKEQQYFIIMEYVDGKTLRQLLTDDGQLKIDTAIEFAMQIGEALQEAHNKGIVHRDVKSDNIMITGANQAKVMDFGLAKLKGSLKLTKSSSTLGTIAYMAPEQIEGKEIDARSDIFSFGILLYEMLTGQLPFKGDYEAALMYAILNEEPDPVEKHLPDISSELLHILNRSLEKDPNNRYQSMKDMLIDLHRLKRDTVKISKTSNELYKTEKTFKVKNKFKKTIIPFIALVIVILSVIGYIFTSYDSEKEFDRIPIAVIDFVNETNETELNGLSGMLITALEQSKRLSVLTRSRMFDILKQLNISDIKRIDESLGRKICKEANVNTLATATIRKFGKLYTIDFKVLNVEKNEYLFTSNEQGEGQESIPAMIDNLSENLRKGLKEKVSEIEASTTNVAEITSPNLEAYQHYFKGEEFIDKLNFNLAREEFKKAIKLDSTFALAYYRLAYAIDWEMNPQQSAKYIVKAILMLNRIPEKDRYLVRAQKARIEEGFEAGITILEEMEHIYSDDKEMLYNIGDWSYHVGDLYKAKLYLENVLAMDSTLIRALQHLTWTYRELGLNDKMMEIAKKYMLVAESEDAINLIAEAFFLSGKPDMGLIWLEKTQKLYPNRYNFSSSFAMMYLFQENYDEAEKKYTTLLKSENPVETQRQGYEYLAMFYPYVGKYQQAIQACEKVIDFYWQSQDTSSASYWQLLKALCKFSGWNDAGEAWMEAQNTFPMQNKITHFLYWTTLSLIYIAHGDYVSAENMAENLTGVNWWLLTVRALIFTEKHECDISENLTETVMQTGSGFAKILALYSLAKCHYEQGNLEKAEKYLIQLQQIYDNRFGIRAIYYPKSFYLLAKIYDQKGDRTLALKNFEKFLDIWKNADADLPILIDAKKRLNNLKTTVL